MITATDNGPYLVAGSATLRDAEGNHYEVSNTIALCRCGHSGTKPFCDGAHEKTNFAALDRAGALAMMPRADARYS
jgi:CDGSH-type Zn-finger protein